VTTPNLGLTEPVDHGSADVWGPILNTDFDLIDAHDHTAGKGVQVPSAALKINADVSWSFAGTHYAIADALAFDMFPTTAASVAAYASALFTNSSDNNLYYRNQGGTNVQITAGNSLNFSVTGGFGGDYTAVGALASFIDASDSYVFQQQVGSAVRQYGKIQGADLWLFEYKANPAAGVPANRVALKSPAALAASYDWTWPAAVPAANTFVMVDNTGALTNPATPTTVNTISVGDIKLTNARTLLVSAALAGLPSGSAATLDGSLASGRILVSTDTTGYQYPIPMSVGDQITGWTLYCNKTTNNTHTITAQLQKLNGTTFAVTGIAAAITNAGNAPGAVQLTQSGLSYTLATGEIPFILFTGSGTTGDQTLELEVVYKRP
jgi:hypothetical protein